MWYPMRVTRRHYYVAASPDADRELRQEDVLEFGELIRRVTPRLDSDGPEGPSYVGPYAYFVRMLEDYREE